MSELNPEYNDPKVLEQVARVESEERPFEYEVGGVEAEDIVDQFGPEDFDTHPMIMVPNRLHWLSESGYLEKVFPNRSSANAAYRLTDRGWNVVDRPEPHEPVEDLED